ncbi:hypothetical protein J3458_021424 [Metarhizium acridum]|uniref:uncharacterized protein n=1 Tax=Metarhizium acridum TaxID=92637 RepID=UPI001C6A97CD|nr:hypothetical protein J3458_021424 [Metarhizium acridum]
MLLRVPSFRHLVSAVTLITLTPVLGHAANQQHTHGSSQRPALLENFDAIGAWFEDVAAINGTSIARRPNVTIAIVGAGISGLTTGLMLDSIGVHNWEIIEASDRIGGRFRTKYVGGTQEWAEMGPMRLPYSIKYRSDNTTHEYTDHRMTFQLAEWLNKLNKNDTKWKVDFIPWLQHHPNELLARGTGRHADGRIPTRGEIAANPELAAPPPMSSAEYNNTKSAMNGILKNETRLREIQRDIWRAHEKAMEENLDDWSEQGMMRHLFKASENVTDAIATDTDYEVFWDEMVHNSNLAQDGGRGAFGETEWKCVDGGFNRLSDAFTPHVQDRVVFNRKIRKLESVGDGKGGLRTRLSWYPSATNRTYESKEYDYTVMTLPFTMTRLMDLPKFSSTLSRAIGEHGLRFQISLQGGAAVQGTVLGEGRAAHLWRLLSACERGHGGAYRGGDWSDRFVSLPDEEYVGMVLDAIVSLHGEEARRLYTGDYEKLCWLQDEHSATSWCRPNVEQHRLYIPSYHRTEHNTIFIGEHTAPTHAWISSSLHSAVRGSVQLLLELGMVDEAKKLNKEWMGRWINRT